MAKLADAQANNPLIAQQVSDFSLLLQAVCGKLGQAAKTAGFGQLSDLLKAAVSLDASLDCVQHLLRLIESRLSSEQVSVAAQCDQVRQVIYLLQRFKITSSISLYRKLLQPLLAEQAHQRIDLLQLIRLAYIYSLTPDSLGGGLLLYQIC